MGTLGRLSAHGIDLEVLRSGAGHPVLLLHGMTPLDPAAPVVEQLHFSAAECSWIIGVVQAACSSRVVFSMGEGSSTSRIR